MKVPRRLVAALWCLSTALAFRATVPRARRRTGVARGAEEDAAPSSFDSLYAPPGGKSASSGDEETVSVPEVVESVMAATAAAEDDEPAAATTSEDFDLAAANASEEEGANLSESVLLDFSARSARNMEVARLQTALERSQMRRKQVEEVVGEEVAALRQQLDRETEAELGRLQSAEALLAQLNVALVEKKEKCAKEERLLVQLQDVAQRTTEEAISASLGEAIETKAKLVAIELLLVEDVEECIAQVQEEAKAIKARLAAMEVTRASLPALDDVDALRLYSWAQVAQLQEDLASAALSMAETDAKVAALRMRINDALEKREAVLGEAPVSLKDTADKKKASGASTAQTKSPRAVDLASLDDAALQSALKSSAQATAEALKTFARSALAASSSFAESDQRQAATKLLGEAGASTTEARAALADASAKVASAESAKEPLDPKYSAQVASKTAGDLATATTKLGGALKETTSALAKSAADAEVGSATLQALSAIGTTATATGLLALRAAKKAADELQNNLPKN